MTAFGTNLPNEYKELMSAFDSRMSDNPGRDAREYETMDGRR